MIVLLLFFPLLAVSQSQLIGHWDSRSPMPVRRSNMATASLQIADTTFIYTFMGLDSTKACGSSLRLEAFRYNTVTDIWQQIPNVPDSEGRIAASVTGINGKIFLIGGYKVNGNCNEYSSPRVDIYDPLSNTWTLGDSTPIPIDDHVQLCYKDSLIITISGWSQNQNTRAVQIYDTYLDAWSSSNNILGQGRFGHAGGISGDTILYIDGVSSSFSHVNQTWKGVIQNGDPHSIVWTNLGSHPGQKTYRCGGFSYQDWILFTGGTNNAYNFDGIGYNGQASIETGRTWGYNLTTSNFAEFARNPDSVMDVRQIVEVDGNQFYVVGGMEAGQNVSSLVSVFVVDSVLLAKEEENLAEASLVVFPTIAEDWIVIKKASLPEGDYQIEFLDGIGRTLHVEKFYHSGGDFHFLRGLLDLPLPAGLVHICLKSANFSETQAFVLIR